MRKIAILLSFLLLAGNTKAELIVDDATVTAAAACTRNTYITWVHLETGRPLSEIEAELAREGITLAYYVASTRSLLRSLEEPGANRQSLTVAHTKVECPL
jgi:hypothetical protein